MGGKVILELSENEAYRLKSYLSTGAVSERMEYMIHLSRDHKDFYRSEKEKQGTRFIQLPPDREAKLQSICSCLSNQLSYLFCT